MASLTRIRSNPSNRFRVKSSHWHRAEHFPSSWPKPYKGESDAHFHARITRAYSDIPEALHLYTIRWEVKGDLTFKYEGLPFQLRLDMFEAVLGLTCKKHGVYYPKLLWALRNEQGRFRDGITHFHFVAARVRDRQPGDVNLKLFCADILAEWRAVGGGWSTVKPYAESLSGCGYVCKGPTGDLDGKEPVLPMSTALQACLQRRLQRHRGA